MLSNQSHLAKQQHSPSAVKLEFALVLHLPVSRHQLASRLCRVNCCCRRSRLVGRSDGRLATPLATGDAANQAKRLPCGRIARGFCEPPPRATTEASHASFASLFRPLE